MAEGGIPEILRKEPALERGVNIHRGKITYEAVATAFEMEYTPLGSM
jgi:alanine dehydrogenase